MNPERKKEVKKVLSQSEYERRIKELQDELEELKKVKVEEEKKPEKGKIWKPELNEIFYYIEECGEVEKDENTGCHIDYAKFKRGNYYKTEEEARHQTNVQKYTNLFKKYVEEHSEPIDWENDSQQKLYIYYNKKYGVISTGIETTNAVQGTIYSSSNRVLIDALSFIGKENAMKYLFNVERED